MSVINKAHPQSQKCYHPHGSLLPSVRMPINDIYIGPVHPGAGLIWLSRELLSLLFNLPLPLSLVGDKSRDSSAIYLATPPLFLFPLLLTDPLASRLQHATTQLHEVGGTATVLPSHTYFWRE